MLYLAGLDFGSSRIGTIAAVPIILGSLATSSCLRLRPDQDCDHETRELAKKVRVQAKLTEYIIRVQTFRFNTASWTWLEWSPFASDSSR